MDTDITWDLEKKLQDNIAMNFFFQLLDKRKEVGRDKVIAGFDCLILFSHHNYDH